MLYIPYDLKDVMKVYNNPTVCQYVLEKGKSYKVVNNSESKNYVLVVNHPKIVIIILVIN